MKRYKMFLMIGLSLAIVTIIAVNPKSPLSSYIVRQYWIRKVKESIPNNKPVSVLPGDSVGQIRIGLTISELESVLGAPASRSEIESVLSYNYPTKGLSVILYEGKVGAISCGDGGLYGGSLLAEAFSGVTDKGISIGSSVQQILNAYGPSVTNRIESPSVRRKKRWRSWAEESNQFSSGETATLCFPYSGIDFFTKNEKVNHIDIYPRLDKPSL